MSDAASGEFGRVVRTLAERICGVMEPGGEGDWMAYRDAAEAVLDEFVAAGQGWCPVHGDALCPEQYMLFADGRIAPGYSQFWSEDIRCGQRQGTYRLPLSGGSPAVTGSAADTRGSAERN